MKSVVRFLNYGSLNIDHVYQVDHINRPGETLKTRDYHTYPGGKGANQSVALARAGAEVCHAGKVGREGQWLLDVLRQAGVNTDFVTVEDGVATGHAIIQVTAQGENCIIVYPGANHAQSPSEIAHHTSLKFDVLLLQNEVNHLPLLIRAGWENGSAVVFNPSPCEPELNTLPLEKVHTLLLNETEAMSLAGCQELKGALDRLSQRLPSVRIVLTLGKDGVCARHQGKHWRQDGHKVEVRDTTAAGDTFTGFYCAAFFSPHLYPRQQGEDDLAAALRVATVAAAHSVGIVGAIPSIPEAKVLALSPPQS